MPVLCRAEIIRAVRIRKLLEQAESEGPAAAAYRDKALAMAAGYPRGHAIVYNGKRLLDGDGDDGHPDLPGH